MQRGAGHGERARAAGEPARRAVGVAHDHVDLVGIDAQAIRDQLLVGGDEPGAVFDVAHHELDAVVLELDRGGLRKAAAAALGVGRHADAAQFPALLGFGAPRLEAGPVGLLHAQIHDLLELAGIEGDLRRRRIRHRRGWNEIAPPDLVGRELELPRGGIDQALDQIGRLRPSGAAIGAHRHRVGAHALHVHGDRRRLVEPGDQIGRARRDECAERREIGAEIGDDRDPQAEEMAAPVHGEFGAGEMVAPLVVADEALGAIRLPFHRALELARSPDRERVLGVDERLHAEAAADVGRDGAQLRLRQLQDRVGERVAHEGRALRPGVERRAIGRRIVIADGVARLHRVRHHAIVDQFDGGDPRGAGERRLGRGEIAAIVVPVEHDVARDMVEQLRRAGLHCRTRVDHGRQCIVFDLDRLGGVAGLIELLGHDQRHRLSHVAHFADRQHRPRRVVARRAVAVLQRRDAGHVAETFGRDILAGEEEQHARHAAGPRGVHPRNARVRRRRAQHVGMHHSRQDDVVGIAALAGDEPKIFEPPQRLADRKFHIASTC